MSAESEMHDARDLLLALWERRLFIACITAAITLAAGATAWFLPSRYDAKVVLSPVSDEDSARRLSGVTAALSQLGGFGSLAGLMSSGSAVRSESIATLQSDTLTQDFIAANDLLPVLFRTQWDAENKRWRPSRWFGTPTLWQGS